IRDLTVTGVQTCALPICGYFPSLVENRETFVALVSRGYWIDIGTPDKYLQAHQDIMDGRFAALPFASMPGGLCVSPEAKIDDGRSEERRVGKEGRWWGVM